MTINKRVKKVRESFGLTQGKFGREIGSTQNYLSQIENGLRMVSPKISKTICMKFGISETWLLNGEGKMFEKTPAADGVFQRLANEYNMSITELSFLEAYLQLPSDKRAELEALIDKALELRARHMADAQRANMDSLQSLRDIIPGSARGEKEPLSE